MINPALLKALIPQDVMDNVQNAAQAFIEMRDEIAQLKIMVKLLCDDRFGQVPTRTLELPGGLPLRDGRGTE